VDVDLQLVLAVDASGSVSPGRFELQKKGYVDAFRHPTVVKAIKSGVVGAIAVTLFQWTGPRLQATIAPWTLLDGARTADAFARTIDDAGRRMHGGGTSISGALDYAAGLFAGSGFRSPRRVIDVSGDGMSTSGRSVAAARDDAIAQGLVINGLPILAVEFDLDRHFERDVIGGPGCFMLPAKDFESFADAVRRKLVSEIASL
jgi:hypothetical protein